MSTRWAAIALLVAMGCGKKGDGAEGDKAAASASSKASAASASASAFASASASAEPAPLPTSGSYDAKVAAVRMPKDAPPFVQTETGLTGPGEISLVLPVKDGVVSGKASGALGEQVIAGNLEGSTLTATARPAASGEPSMTGVIEATIEGVGDARVVKGTMRASSGDGRLVREAAFTTKKK